MLTFFPKSFSNKAIVCYVITLAVVSVFFIRYALPFQFMLFGIVFVVVFFNNASKLTMDWRRYRPETFTKKLFKTALLIRVVYMVFIYFYYIEMTGLPHMYYPGDELLYEWAGTMLREYGFGEFGGFLRKDCKIAFSDSGYCWWLGIENFLLGTHALSYRSVKCLMDAFSCVLIYNLASRNFGESTGRVASIFCMLMPNMWYYCGLTLKETEMAFMTVLFVERADLAIHSKEITIKSLLFPGVVALAMFTFRTALAAVLIAALVAALIFSSGKQLELWKKVLYTSLFAVWMFLTVGVEMIQETQELWEGRTTNQEVGYASRSVAKGGNTFAKYASASVFAPLIFTIPFPTLVAVPNQENQMLLHGGNFIKNIMSGFTILALFLLLIRGDWRKHVLPIAVTCGYLVVLVFSNFAHSERFHFPVLGLELMFAAYGVSQLTNKYKRWYTIWLIGISVANIGWAWIKLAGRGYSI
jgi:hypothetical protein